MGATSAEGFEALGSSWGIVARPRGASSSSDVDRAPLVGRRPDAHRARRASRRARTSRYGLLDWFAYFTTAAGAARAGRTRPTTSTTRSTQMTGSGMGVIGTPEDAIAQIERLLDQSGRLRHAT